ncbi:PfkB family carbohydrate kinase [Streptomyces sp. JV185]|uniref:PfkB family carbohydrate kinase n=1 Tax=Streptomyces sp. JV185 TaxID=858638 RepID=UPI003FA7830A
MREILREGRADTVVATAGSGGSHVLTRDGGSTPHHIPATAPPAPVVDSNGAGDAYVCGFLYGRPAGRDRLECGRLGAVAGAYACTAGFHRPRPAGSPAGIGRHPERESVVRAVLGRRPFGHRGSRRPAQAPRLRAVNPARPASAVNSSACATRRHTTG